MDSHHSAGEPREPQQGDTSPGALSGRDQAAGRLSAAEKQVLLRLARQTLEEVTRRGTLPEVPAGDLSPTLAAPAACFVTLTQFGRLRGCIGHIHPQEPLCQAVIDNTRNAALRDSRFPPVQPHETAELIIEISILTEPQPLAFVSPEELLRKLRPRTDGVVLHLGGRSATFLPQVWEHVPDTADFLDRLALKAGGQPPDWRSPQARIATYQVESFREQAPRDG
ncbi:MAG: AmmeMemoRadiSam system protein A [Verrucomicrobia bacterium]|nr:AmmeMemoRadiSam system protein A [Verrucomicrobiota bacterium]